MCKYRSTYKRLPFSLYTILLLLIFAICSSPNRNIFDDVEYRSNNRMGPLRISKEAILHILDRLFQGIAEVNSYNFEGEIAFQYLWRRSYRSRRECVPLKKLCPNNGVVL